jgi:hypothetical protein
MYFSFFSIKIFYRLSFEFLSKIFLKQFRLECFKKYEEKMKVRSGGGVIIETFVLKYELFIITHLIVHLLFVFAVELLLS